MYRIKRAIIFLIAVGSILVGMLLVSAFSFLWFATLSWTKTTGTVERFELQPGIGLGDSVGYDLEFKFQIDGQDLTGNKISILYPNSVLPRREQTTYRNKFRSGMKVDVYYDPEFPQENSFIERLDWNTAVLIPCGTLFFGLWVLFLLRKTRVRAIPRHVLEADVDYNSPHWHEIYQTVLEKEQIEICGSAWYARSTGITQWPKSTVGLVATPNTIGLIRGPFTVVGLTAAGFTLLLEYLLSWWLALFHGGAFVFELANRYQTWRFFASGQDPNLYSTAANTANIVPIDHVRIHGYDERKRELWLRLPTRPVDDCVRLPRHMTEQAEQFIGFVMLMQQTRQTDLEPEEGPLDEIEFLD